MGKTQAPRMGRTKTWAALVQTRVSEEALARRVRNFEAPPRFGANEGLYLQGGSGKSDGTSPCRGPRNSHRSGTWTCTKTDC